MSRQWDGNPLGLGLVAEDKPSEFFIHKYSDFVVGVIYVRLASARPNYTLCTGIGNGVFLGGPYVLRCYRAIFHKISAYWSLPSNKSIYYHG